MTQENKRNNDTIVFRMTGLSTDGEIETRDITAGELRNAPIGTQYSVGSEKDGETMTVTASSGKFHGGVGVVYEIRSGLYNRTTRQAGWLSDKGPIREMELDNNLSSAFHPEIPAELRTNVARLIGEYDELQEKIDLMKPAVSKEEEKKNEKFLVEQFNRMWENMPEQPVHVYYNEDGPVLTDTTNIGKPAIEIAEIPPFDRLDAMLDMYRVTPGEVVRNALTGSDELEQKTGLHLSGPACDKIGNAYAEERKAGREVNSEKDFRRLLAIAVEEILTNGIVEDKVIRYMIEKPKWRLDEINHTILGMEDKQKAIDKELQQIKDLPSMKRMAYEIRCQAFTKNVNKDLERYIKKTDPYELQRGKTEAYIVPKTFFRKIEKAALRTDPDWKSKFYKIATVQEEIGDESKYRVSLPPGSNAVLTLCGSQRGVQALKEDLRREYLRSVQVEAEQFDISNDMRRVDRLIEIAGEMSSREKICHELSNTYVKGGEELRTWYQTDLKDLRDERDQLELDLRKRPGLQNTFDKFRKEINALNLDARRAVSRLEDGISYNPSLGKAVAPCRLLENMADKYGIQPAQNIPGFEMKGTHFVWSVAKGSDPLTALGINKDELGRQLIRNHVEKLRTEIQNAIEHPVLKEEKKYAWYRNKNRGMSR